MAASACLRRGTSAKSRRHSLRAPVCGRGRPPRRSKRAEGAGTLRSAAERARRAAQPRPQQAGGVGRRCAEAGSEWGPEAGGEDVATRQWCRANGGGRVRPRVRRVAHVAHHGCGARRSARRPLPAAQLPACGRVWRRIPPALHASPDLRLAGAGAGAGVGRVGYGGAVAQWGCARATQALAGWRAQSRAGPGKHTHTHCASPRDSRPSIRAARTVQSVPPPPPPPLQQHTPHSS